MRLGPSRSLCPRLFLLLGLARRGRERALGHMPSIRDATGMVYANWVGGGVG
jgi:hypothetical protein